VPIVIDNNEQCNYLDLQYGCGKGASFVDFMDDKGNGMWFGLGLKLVK